MRRVVHCWQCDRFAVLVIDLVEHITSEKEKRAFCTLTCAKRWLDGLIARCLAAYKGGADS